MLPIQWLNREQEIVRTLPDGTQWRQKTTVLKRYSELLAVNRGHSNVQGFGQVQGHPQSPYLRFGLTLQEAFELTTLTGIFTGLTMSVPADKQEAAKLECMTAIKSEIERTKREGFDPLKDAVKIDNSNGDDNSVIQVYSEDDIKKVAGLTSLLRRKE